MTRIRSATVAQNIPASSFGQCRSFMRISLPAEPWLDAVDAPAGGEGSPTTPKPATGRPIASEGEPG